MLELRTISKVLGALILLLGVGMLIPLGIALWQHHQLGTDASLMTIQAMAGGIAIAILVASALLIAGRGAEDEVGRAEAVILVFSVWTVGALVGSMPFFIWGQIYASGHPEESVAFASLINCMFETVSGLTTTGASILSNIESVPSALLFWRAMMQWYGGLGIVVLFVAILPFIAGGNRRLFSAEATGITKDGSTPKIQETARALWTIYVGITILQVVLMMLFDPDMSLFTAMTFAFSTTATAGFSVYNSSVGNMVPAVQWTIIAFMLLSGINYGLYYALWRRKFSEVLRDIELRTYLVIMFVAVLFVAVNISSENYGNMFGNMRRTDVETIFRDATFQVVSITTTTGFSNADSNMWPLLSQVILIGLMFVGGCGGSTGGGIKVIRFVVLFKLFYYQLEKAYRPNVVRPLKIGRKVLGDHLKVGILIHILIVFFLAFLGTFLLACFESDIDAISAFTASVATINNIGPGFGLVGATGNYEWMSDPSKLLLTLWMLIGRLEVFTVLVIFSPRFWKQK